MSTSPSIRRLLGMALGLVWVAISARATTFVPVEDGALTDRAALVVDADITAVRSASVGRLPAIDYEIHIRAVVKGSVPGDVIVVRVPGGVRPDGTGLHLLGMPSLEVGTRALLFLRPGAGGFFTLVELMLGAFTVTEENGRSIARRPLAGAHAVPTKATRTSRRPTTPRDLTRFVQWIRDHALADTRAPDYFVTRFLDGDTSASPPFNKFAIFQSDTRPPPLGCGAEGGNGIRWFDFDGGLSVPWRRHEGGLPGLDSTDPGGANAFAAALETWSDAVPAIDLRNAGTTAATGGLREDDGVNTILFGDPFDEIPGAFDGSGLLALGGAWFRCDQTASHGDLPFHIAFEGDIVIQDGIESFFATSSDPDAAARELLGHEIGHTLGLDHSFAVDALMFPTIHDDGRGATLSEDDRLAATALYDLSVVGAPGPPPAPPTNVAVSLVAPDTVLITWEDQDAAAIRIERRLGDGPFRGIATVGNVDRHVDTGLLGGSDYGYRLRTIGIGGASTFSEEVSITTGGTLEPVAPSNLLAAPLSSDRVVLSWQDNATNEIFYRVDLDTGGIWTELPQVILLANTTRVTLSGLTPATPYRFRVRAEGAAGSSVPSNPFVVTTFPDDAACVGDNEILCLLDGRFAVRVRYRNQHDNGTEGMATAVASTNKTGMFWFFSDSNIELIVKMIDGADANGHAWVFTGGLSDVEYWVEITDTQTDATRIYHNPPGELCGNSDNLAFPLGAPSPPGPPDDPLDLGVVPPIKVASPAVKATSGFDHLDHLDALPALPASPDQPGACMPDATTLCLLNNRFAVTVAYRNQHNGGTEGTGQAIAGSNRSGFLWFFSPESTELVIKMLDGTSANGHYWLYFGALSDVEYTVSAHDTLTGLTRTYTNAPGELCGRADIQAFEERPEPPDPDDPLDV